MQGRATFQLAGGARAPARAREIVGVTVGVVHDPDRPGGWGLALVESMSDRWGIERGDRTRVWFELDTEEAAA